MSIRLSQTAHAQQFLEEASGNLQLISTYMLYYQTMKRLFHGTVSTEYLMIE